MSAGYPQPNASQLRLGLHALIVALAVVVLLRGLLLKADAAIAVTLLVALFVTVYVLRARTQSGAPRRALLGLMVATWLGLELLGADAAYLSLGLFLVFLTELAMRPALAGVAAMTAVDLLIGLQRDGTAEAVVAPLLGAGLSLLFGVGYRVLFEVTRSQRDLIEELQRTRAELADSERAAGRARERQRLAQEIHDTVAQGLSSIQLLLHAAEDEPLPQRAKIRISAARETAAAGLVEARRMVAELAPADLAGASLSAALDRVCARAVTHTRFLTDGVPVPVPMPVEAALVRIAQSALANVDQHAGDQAQAVVTLGWGGGRVRLDVVDDGPGFDTSILTSTATSTFGLDTIRRRVAELGGDVTLESEPGHTALAVSFPLDAGSTP